MQCAPTGQAKSKAVLPARGGGLKHCKEACALRLPHRQSQHLRSSTWTWTGHGTHAQEMAVKIVCRSQGDAITCGQWWIVCTVPGHVDAREGLEGFDGPREEG